MTDKQRTTKVDPRLLEEVKEAIAEVEFVGRGNIPEELDIYFNGGVNQSSVLRAGLHYLRQTWKQAKEDLERRRAGAR